MYLYSLHHLVDKNNMHQGFLYERLLFNDTAMDVRSALASTSGRRHGNLNRRARPFVGLYRYGDLLFLVRGEEVWELRSVIPSILFGNDPKLTDSQLNMDGICGRCRLDKGQWTMAFSRYLRLLVRQNNPTFMMKPWSYPENIGQRAGVWRKCMPGWTCKSVLFFL